MVNKFVRLIPIAAMVAIIGIIVSSQPTQPPATDGQNEQVILEMTMYQIIDHDGEYLLVYKTQYANHDAEWLQKDGKRLKGAGIVNCPGEYFIHEGDDSYHFKIDGEKAIKGKKYKTMVLGGPEMQKYQVKELIYSGDRLKKLQALKYASSDVATALAPGAGYESLVFVVRHDKIEISASRLGDWPPYVKALATIEPDNSDYKILIKAFAE